MERSSVTIQKRVEGQVVFNNGQFVEIETYGIDGIETGLILDTIQIDRCEAATDTRNFKRTFPRGTCLEISTTLEISRIHRSGRDWKKLREACEEEQRKFAAASKRKR
jgi:hypothetical protein